ELDAGRAGVDDDGIAGLHQRRGLVSDTPLFFEMRRALRLVGRLRRRAADHLAVDPAAISPRHHAALGQEAEVLADGLHADAEAFRERRDLHAAVLADEL